MAKIPLRDNSSNAAQEYLWKHGFDPKRDFNWRLFEALGITERSDAIEALSVPTVDEWLDALPYQEDREDWEEAAREQYYVFHNRDPIPPFTHGRRSE